MIKLILIISLMMSAFAEAGGYSFAVKVSDVDVPNDSKNTFSLKLIPVDESKYWEESKCEVLSIQGNYDLERWKGYKN